MKKFKCTRCKFSSKTLVDLNEHKKKHNVFKHSCELCGKEDTSESKIEEHIRNEHMTEIFKRFKNSRNKNAINATSYKEKIKYSTYERKSNGLCSYWAKGKCTFGEFCRFSHHEPPTCYFGKFCNRGQTCRFSHVDANDKMSFLGQTKRHSNHF